MWVGPDKVAKPNNNNNNSIQHTADSRQQAQATAPADAPALRQQQLRGWGPRGAARRAARGARKTCCLRYPETIGKLKECNCCAAILAAVAAGDLHLCL